MVAKEFWLVFRRLVLIVLTILAVFNVALSLLQSLNQPQVQSRLELYQTNLLLEASEFETDNADLRQILNASLGENSDETAQKRYEDARSAAQSSRKTLETSDRVSSPEQKSTIREIRAFIDEIDLELGILQAQQGHVEEARQTWQELSDRGALDARDRAPVNPPEIVRTAAILQQLWSQKPIAEPTKAKAALEQTLDGWFRDRALRQFCQVQNDSQCLAQLQQAEQIAAREALVKLSIIGGIPALGGLVGVGLAIVLVVQFALARERSLLALPNTLAWQVPWNAEVIWQVLIVGFFFIGQFVLPLFFGLLGLDPTGFDLRQKALLVLASYVLLAAAGLSVLYVSIKPFFPLPEGWFRFKVASNWILWGLGGYLIAIPVVVVVSLVNQQVWDGQGGSNPILSLALQAQDWVALAIFFFTASIAAPVFEEIMFRGFLLPSLTRYLPVWAAIGTSSLVFAIAHLSLSEVLPLTALGMILGIVYARSRNLLSSILVHSLWNSGTLLTLFVLGS